MQWWHVWTEVAFLPAGGALVEATLDPQQTKCWAAKSSRLDVVCVAYCVWLCVYTFASCAHTHMGMCCACVRALVHACAHMPLLCAYAFAFVQVYIIAFVHAFDASVCDCVLVNTGVKFSTAVK